MPHHLVSLALAVCVGLAAGVALVAMFAIVSIPLLAAPVSPDHRSWVAKNTTQCSEPWQLQDTTLKGFFNQRGILIYDMQSIGYLPPGSVVCEACSCTSGSTLFLQVAKNDVHKMKQYGFVEQVPNKIGSP